MTDPGVTISLREIYDAVLEVVAEVKQLGNRITQLENIVNGVDKVDERSREALAIATEAKEKAVKLEENQTWIIRAIIGTIFAAIGGLLLTK